MRERPFSRCKGDYLMRLSREPPCVPSCRACLCRYISGALSYLYRRASGRRLMSFELILARISVYTPISHAMCTRFTIIAVRSFANTSGNAHAAGLPCCRAAFSQIARRLMKRADFSRGILSFMRILNVFISLLIYYLIFFDSEASPG